MTAGRRGEDRRIAGSQGRSDHAARPDGGRAGRCRGAARDGERRCLSCHTTNFRAIEDQTGPESADLDHYARVFSEALGRTIRYRDAPTSEWSEKLWAAGLSEHVVHHLTVMTELHKQGRYDRMSEDYLKLTGETPTRMADFVKLHAAEFTRPSRFGAGP